MSIQINNPIYAQVGTNTNNKSDPLTKTIVELLLGLTCGEDYKQKQWYLEKALRCLCEDQWVDEAKKNFQWEDGIEP